jgi:segregation and condensation protein B
MELSTKIEALLFYRGEPVKTSVLAKTLDASPEEVTAALGALRAALAGHGIALIEGSGEVELRTAPDASALIEMIRKEELSKDLGKAGLETLSIILYKGPISRVGIDHIRGVNSTFILRNLLVRGLIERISNPNDERSYLYRTTLDLLSFLGASRREELPEFTKIKDELTALESAQHAGE